jgi:2-polyprenyl-3-methyl-5-hydroxy-6-metoxy-1,4-benzoquinol methylase
MARYDEFAGWYDDWVGDDVSEPCASAVLDAVGDVRGLRVLDLGCGSGRIARALAKREAQVVGIDISKELVNRAERKEAESQLGINYVVADAASNVWRAVGPFDGVVSNMALMDIDDLEGTLSSVASVLVPNGWFVFSIFHPCFPGFGVRLPSWPAEGSYFDERWWNTGGNGCRGRVGIYHRTISSYLNALLDAGFELTSFGEPAGAEADGEPIPTPFWIIVSSRLT